MLWVLNADCVCFGVIKLVRKYCLDIEKLALNIPELTGKFVIVSGGVLPVGMVDLMGNVWLLLHPIGWQVGWLISHAQTIRKLKRNALSTQNDVMKKMK